MHSHRTLFHLTKQALSPAPSLLRRPQHAAHLRPPTTKRTTASPDFLLRTTASTTIIRKMSVSAMGKRLEGKTIIITGASSGIGRATALEFARTSPKNLKLVLTARRAEKLEEIKAQIARECGEGVQVLAVKCDQSKPEEVRGFVDRLPEGWRDVNVLVNNA
jgi:NADPH:quinone reductase-like Zn-dependent oxidoreductase